MEESYSEGSIRSSPSESSPGTRPNRWTGPPSTWQSLTEDEQSLAHSIDLIRNRELKIHLYNAFALKQRGRKLRVARRDNIHLPRDNILGDTKEETSRAAAEEECDGQDWMPSKNWTAWPLDSENVPREGEIVGPEDEEDKAFTLRRVDVARPSRAIGELLVGVISRFAKESWESRTRETTPVAPDSDEFEPRRNLSRDVEREHDSLSPVIKEPSPESPPSRLLKPVLSADDDLNGALLSPLIRRTLSQIDLILVALHEARQVCERYSLGEANNGEPSSYENPQKSSPRPKRPVGRPRKSSGPFGHADENRGGESLAIDSVLLRTKTTHRGRPQKAYERIHGENQQEYLVRIARLQKKSIPSFAPPRTPSRPLSPSPEQFRKSPLKRDVSEGRENRRTKRLRTRDWSEVLGLAAIVGFSPAVIARATQRCANIFGEGMEMKHLEQRVHYENTDVSKVYQPEEVSGMIAPSPEEASEVSSSDTEIDGAVHVDGFLRPMKYRLKKTRGAAKHRNRGELPEDEAKTTIDQPGESGDEVYGDPTSEGMVSINDSDSHVESES